MKAIFKNKWFLVGLAIKFVALFFGGSEYLQKLFIPFLDMAVTHPGQNPWELLPSGHFPYGSVLFGFLFIPKFLMHLLLGEAALGINPMSFFSVKVVLLAFDFLLLRTLLSFAPHREDKLIWFYWLNPVLFYISYVHGQLDVVSMYFAILSIVLLSKDRFEKAAFVFALAVLCKFHTIILLPFAVSYLWNTNFRKPGIVKICKYLALSGVIVAMGVLPQVLAHNISYISFGSPEALSIFGAQIRIDNERVLFIGFLLSVGVLARLCMSTRITADGLFFGSGILFGCLLLGTSTMPGWYFWLLPFIAVFYSTRSLVFRSLYAVTILLYFTHFLVSDLPLGGFVNLANGVTFSLLQLATLGLIVSLWVSVIRFEAPLLRRTRPLLIGLAGNSGTGKNTITDVLQALFGQKATTVVEGDDYHKWERGHNRWQDYTHLNPKANFLEEMAEHTRDLVTGKLVYQPHYDHSTGKFTEPREIKTTKSLIVQGLHTFYLASFRKQFDLKIFMSPDEDLRIAWKVLRDVNQRGHSFEKVMTSIRSRDFDSVAHINPQKKMADWIVEYKLKGQGGFDYASLTKSPEFYVRHVVWNDTPLSSLMDSLNQISTVKASVEVNSENIDQVVVQIDGDISTEQIASVAKTSFAHLRHLTRSDSEPVWKAGQEGIMQLLTLALIERQIFAEGLK